MEAEDEKAPILLRKRVIFDQFLLVSFFYWPLQVGLFFLISSYNEILAQEMNAIFVIKLIGWASFAGIFIGAIGCLFSLLAISLIAVPCVIYMVHKNRMSCSNMLLFATLAGVLMAGILSGGNVFSAAFLYWSLNGTIIGGIVYWRYYSPDKYPATLCALKKGT